MALIDFGMKARRERDEARADLIRKHAALQWAISEIDGKTAYHSDDHFDQCYAIARKALGRPVGGGDE